MPRVQNPGGFGQALSHPLDNQRKRGNPQYRTTPGKQTSEMSGYQSLPETGDNAFGADSYLPMPPRQRPSNRREE